MVLLPSLGSLEHRMELRIVSEGVWICAMHWNKMLGGMVGGNVMVGVGFCDIDNEVWNIHLGEDIINFFGLWEWHISMVWDGEGVDVVSCIIVFDKGFVDFMISWGLWIGYCLALLYFWVWVASPFNFVVEFCGGGAIVVKKIVMGDVEDWVKL